jgi:2-amino-4-hydroxy-6-hydroxymethyldihydropteridine diphosphokinase
MRGASVLRVHDVAENRAALDIFKTLSAAAKPSARLEDDGRARIVLALGGNVGDKTLSLRRALRAIAGEPGIELTAVSRLYRTAPWGKKDQDWFVNACALGLTRLAPAALLERMKALEVDLGRVSTERWGPRVIDIDLVAYDDISLRSEKLTLPHPELFNRAFVLVPLAEIAPDLIIAGVRVGDAAASSEAAEVMLLD